MEDFILKGDIGWSVSKDEMKTVSGGYLVCVGSISQGGFEEIPEEYRDLPVRDLTGKLIVPGLTDLHIHAPQYGFRGTSMDLELLEWLEQQTFPAEAAYEDVEYAKKAYSIFVERMRTSATTRACIFATRHGESTKILMDLMEETGLISFVGKVNMDRNAPETPGKKCCLFCCGYRGLAGKRPWKIPADVSHFDAPFHSLLYGRADGISGRNTPQI